MLGDLYEEGIGTDQDYSKALYWHQKAAEQDDQVAQTNLGRFYRDGHGVNKDVSKALYWYRKAANQGYGPAIHEWSKLKGRKIHPKK